MLQRYVELKKELQPFLDRFSDEFVESTQLIGHNSFSIEQSLGVPWYEPPNPERVLTEAVRKKVMYPYLSAGGFRDPYIALVAAEIGAANSINLMGEMTSRGRNAVYQQPIRPEVARGTDPLFRSIVLDWVGDSRATVPRLLCAIDNGPERNPELVKSRFVAVATERDKNSTPVSIALLFLHPAAWFKCFAHPDEAKYADRLKAFELGDGL